MGDFAKLTLWGMFVNIFRGLLIKPRDVLNEGFFLEGC